MYKYGSNYLFIFKVNFSGFNFVPWTIFCILNRIIIIDNTVDHE